ncbi:MAG: nodulation protein NodH, partial [Paracoccaceae bacterium]
NPAEMEAGLARIDWFEAAHTPNFEPRRNAAVPSYVAVEGAPLLFQPMKAGPEVQLRRWLAQYGELCPSFDRRTLREWKERHHGFRSFTVLRHPLARAHAAFCDYLVRDWLPELRPYLKRVHRFELPDKGEVFADVEGFREGFKVFLDFAKFNLTGRTEIKVMPHVATQLATHQGFAGLQSPDFTLREDRLAEGLGYLTAEVGLPFKPLPEVAEQHPFSLQEIWGVDLEEAAEAAYVRDYEAYGFGRWRL